MSTSQTPIPPELSEVVAVLLDVSRSQASLFTRFGGQMWSDQRADHEAKMLRATAMLERLGVPPVLKEERAA
ncbi:hypothetical protein PUR29_35035 [Methylobacterium ajmalii]|uniref:Uncharacterized protein n=1 Tax=Methylobacterium ajmalii TaxID=2738439 RepID=A0ABV0A7K3_9HYPH